MTPLELIAKMRADVAAKLANEPRRISTPKVVSVLDNTATPTRDLTKQPLVNPTIVSDIVEKEKQYPVSIAGLVQHGIDKLTGNTTYKEHRNGEIRQGSTNPESSLANAGTVALADPRLLAGTAATALTVLPLIYGREGYNDAMNAVSGVGNNIKSGFNDVVDWVKNLYSYAANYLKDPSSVMLEEAPAESKPAEEKPAENKPSEAPTAKPERVEAIVEGANNTTTGGNKPEDKKEPEPEKDSKDKKDNKNKERAKEIAKKAGEKGKQVGKGVVKTALGIGALGGAGGIGYAIANSDGKEATAQNVEEYLQNQGLSTETLKAIERNDSNYVTPQLNIEVTNKESRRGTGW